MRGVFELISKIACGDGSVLITGESGVGKELVARSIHKNSNRSAYPIIPINCSALPGSLFESELFGYEKGAFTGAVQSKPGLVELAGGGTLFLDEVCEMSQAMQVKLLRMLEDRKVRRVGGKQERAVDIRIVTATNRDVDEMLDRGHLRDDFYYRINTIHIEIPPLRERTDDIPLLANHFLQELDRKYGRRLTALEPEAVEALCRYPWSGNVRELRNVIERTYYLANPPGIRLDDLPTYLTSHASRPAKPNWDGLSYREAKERALELFEKDYLGFKLEKYDWNVSKTAARCGLDRRTIHRLIKRYDLRSS